METQILRINPFDTFFFRDGKPFSMGEETWADGVFPPAPSVIYGALRSLWLSQQKNGFSAENIEASEKLIIKGIFLEFNNTQIALPAPKDLVHEKGNSKITLGLSSLKSKIIGKTPIQNIAIQSEAEYVEEFTNTFLRVRQLRKYLNSDFNNLSVENDFLVEESKVGIGRQFGTRTTQQSSLYRVDMKRFDSKNTPAIIVECNGLTFSDSSIAKIGGEGKSASVTIVDNQEHTKVKTSVGLNDNHFKLYLATPAIFDNVETIDKDGKKIKKHHGWLPNWINPKTLEANYEGLRLKLKATVLGKPISIGGFNIKTTKKVKRGPKIMYKAVPAGSVYHFELLEGGMERVIETFHYQSISEHKAHEGFGITYIGK